MMPRIAEATQDLPILNMVASEASELLTASDADDHRTDSSGRRATSNASELALYASIRLNHVRCVSAPNATRAN